MFDLRALTLGPVFNPKVEDIPTPAFHRTRRTA